MHCTRNPGEFMINMFRFFTKSYWITTRISSLDIHLNQYGNHINTYGNPDGKLHGNPAWIFFNRGAILSTSILDVYQLLNCIWTVREGRKYIYKQAKYRQDSTINERLVYYSIRSNKCQSANASPIEKIQLEINAGFSYGFGMNSI